MPLPEDSEACNPLILNEKEECILAVARDMAYVTAEDIKQLLYPERSLSTVQRALTKLAGGQGSDQILYRFPMPATTSGMKQLVYALGTKGREILGVEGYHRPYKLRALSYSHLRHHLSLTRFVCSALVWCRDHPQVRLADVRLSHELAGELGKAETASQGTPTSAPVVPDGWLHFELLDGENGSHTSYVPTLLEIDGGTEYRRRLKQHVSDRIEFIRNGKYVQFFGVEAVRIAYVVVGSRSQPLSSRLSAICAWTKEVLTDLKLEEWSDVFYLSSLVYEDIYNLKHFSELIWRSPGDSKSKRLLEQ